MSTRLPIPEGCLNATCIRYGNGKYGGLADIFQSSQHGARRLRTRVHTEASVRPHNAHARVYELGAKRAAVRGYSITDDSGSEEERLQWYM